MKKWHLLLAALCLTVSTMTVLADGVPEGTQTGKSSAVILTDPTVNMKNLSDFYLSLIHISEPTRRRGISYAVFCLKKKKQK